MLARADVGACSACRRGSGLATPYSLGGNCLHAMYMQILNSNCLCALYMQILNVNSTNLDVEYHWTNTQASRQERQQCMLIFSHDVHCCFAVCCTKLSLSAAIILLCAVMISPSCWAFCYMLSRPQQGHTLWLGSQGIAVGWPPCWLASCLLAMIGQSAQERSQHLCFGTLR